TPTVRSTLSEGRGEAAASRSSSRVPPCRGLEQCAFVPVRPSCPWVYLPSELAVLNPRRTRVMKAHHQLYKISLLLPTSLLFASCSSSAPADDPAALDPGLAVATQADDPAQGPHVNAITEAPTGFDGLSNGNCTQAEMREAGLTFREVEAFEDG